MTYHSYHAFGLSLDSEIPLPDLPGMDRHAAPADVLITSGTVNAPVGHEDVGLYIVPRGAVLNIPEVGRYLITKGNRIVVDPAPSATDRNVRLYLLGSAFGAILHQRQMLPLHANVIDFGGAAVAFMGHSGAGKSTLANWFHDRGLAILGDDVCVVRDVDAGHPVAEPGLPRIRLWGDALRASGRDASEFEASFDDMDKYDVPIPAIPARDPVRLAAIYHLQAAQPDHAGGVDRLTGVNAIEALVANTYRGGYLPLMGGVRRHLEQCVALARRVPVFALHRRWGLDIFAEEAAQVEAHVRAVLVETDWRARLNAPSIVN
ncbi:hypothetical protein [Sphingomonas sp.]|jgi:hypothetical protein|uniref:hypothetical protein n=1 Tax=Sphingomonas sp. TaxID=28214 RepID=UPI002D7FCD71|nr:hypothetical protein [Sphingomonas sp.]HEU0044533.1 hypothetical protein [Sphingomonas sp.]